MCSPQSRDSVIFDSVTIRHGKRTILDSISVIFKEGEITGILGPNGAGKTNLLHAIMGLRKPVSGKIVVLGKTIPPTSAELRERIGIVFQDTALYEELTVKENLQFTASLYNITSRSERISQVMELLGIKDRENDAIATLSGGYKRRVAIARSLLHQPELLVIDEPTLGVDVETRHVIWSHLRLLRKQGITVVVSTNYLDEAIALCDVVVVLRNGRIVITDTPNGLVERAGACIDVECNDSDMGAIAKLTQGIEGIIRIEPTASGLTVFYRGGTLEDQIVARLFAHNRMRGYRVRGADLAEIFRSLEQTEV